MIGLVSQIPVNVKFIRMVFLCPTIPGFLARRYLLQVTWSELAEQLKGPRDHVRVELCIVGALCGSTWTHSSPSMGARKLVSDILVKCGIIGKWITLSNTMSDD